MGWGATALPGVGDTPWPSKPAALCLLFPRVCLSGCVCLQGVKRLLSSAAVVSPSMEKAPLVLAAWRCPALSCPTPGLCHLPITLCLGQCFRAQQPCFWALLCASCSRWLWLMVTAEARREKMSALMCCGAWQGCGTQHAQEPQTASCTLLCQGVLMIWGALTTRILQGTSPLSHLWDSHRDAPAEPQAHSADVRPNKGVVRGWDGPGRCTVRFTAPGYLFIK